tara:strand:- start:309 stop:1004 length:696 start_codon:yes stop_codon:yes gene_type:complete
MSWQKFHPDSLAWSERENRQEKLITEEPSGLKQVMFSSGATFNNASTTYGVLLLVVSGGLQLDDGQEVKKEDLLWIPARTEKGTVTGLCLAGTCVFELQVSAPLGPAEITLIKKQAFAWQSFDDPAGRPTQPVQLLMGGNLSILRTRFVPEYTAGDHWHDFDTWYFITDGDMRFGHEGVYKTGQVRQVTGGYSYGPEEPGDDGVEFVLVSVGGPVMLHWADMEPAPRGQLQ